MIVTVTLNAAVDRTLTVPNFQLGHRHRASQALTLAGGKGINIARALKLLEVPVVATGLVGGRTGQRILEELSAEAILNDFVRIEDESRTSSAVVDPTAGSFTEINEWGPHVTREELERLLEKLHYHARSADFVVFAGTLPRGVEENFYSEAIRDLNRHGMRTVLDTEGEPLRRGMDAEPFLVSPNQGEAEDLVGQELAETEDFVLRARGDRGARRAQRADHPGVRLLRTAAREPPQDRVPRERCAGRHDLACRRRRRPPCGLHRGAGRRPPVEDALRSAVAAGTAATLEVGAGRFDPRQASRLASEVDVRTLDPVASG